MLFLCLIGAAGVVGTIFLLNGSYDSTRALAKEELLWTGFPKDTILEDDGLFWEEACWGLYLTSWLGVTNSGFISGSLLGGILLDVEVAFLAFLPAIFILQKFTGKEVRDGVLASFNIFNLKIKNT